MTGVQTCALPISARSTDRLNEVTQQNLETKQQLDNVTQSDQALSMLND